jgi:hypothetical protein
MKKFRITYLPFPQSSAQSSDIIIPAKDEEQAEQIFQQRYPNYGFIKAEEEL